MPVFSRKRCTFSLAVLIVAAAITPAAGATHSGRQGELVVDVPRFDAAARVDATLDEPEWARAARLIEFSQYAPADGRPASNDTLVLVWYSPTAIYFGIEARAAPGTLRATLADRDHIGRDDQVQLFLSTFNDGRQALMFAVNPLGVQADGTLIEGTTSGPDAADLSADFVFESKGRITDDGYVVEMRIPFKSLRYQSRDPQDWGLHVVRARAERRTPGPLGARQARGGVVPGAGRHASRAHGSQARPRARSQPVRHREGRRSGSAVPARGSTTPTRPRSARTSAGASHRT